MSQPVQQIEWRAEFKTALAEIQTEEKTLQSDIEMCERTINRWQSTTEFVEQTKKWATDKNAQYIKERLTASVSEEKANEIAKSLMQSEMCFALAVHALTPAQEAVEQMKGVAVELRSRLPELQSRQKEIKRTILQNLGLSALTDKQLEPEVASRLIELWLDGRTTEKVRVKLHVDGGKCDDYVMDALREIKDEKQDAGTAKCFEQFLFVKSQHYKKVHLFIVYASVTADQVREFFQSPKYGGAIGTVQTRF